jgi:hypothetical protein
MRDSMIIYRSFFEAINSLSSEEQSKVWRAICEYGMNYKETELSGISETIFNLIRPQLDANLRRYENGMRPKIKAKQKQKESRKEGNDNVNVNENENQNEKRSFIAPTQEEVISFFKSNGYTEEAASKAFQYYQDGEWKDSSGKKIISWKQKMRGVWFKQENRIAASSSSGYSRGSNYNPAR